MDFSAIFMLLAGKYPILLAVFDVLGMLVVVAQAIIPLTPSQSDDAAWEKIKSIPLIGSLISALVAFAPVQKK